MLLKSRWRLGQVPGDQWRRPGQVGQVDLQLAERCQPEVRQVDAAEQLRPRHHCQGPEAAGVPDGGGD